MESKRINPVVQAFKKFQASRTAVRHIFGSCFCFAVLMAVHWQQKTTRLAQPRYKPLVTAVLVRFVSVSDNGYTTPEKILTYRQHSR